MDFGALPPEINSGRMYCGPGCGPMLAAAAAWDELAADLDSAAASYQTVIWDLTGAAWRGPASAAMAGSGGGLHRVDDDDCCAVRADGHPGQGRRCRLRGRVCDDGAATDDRRQPHSLDVSHRD